MSPLKTDWRVAVIAVAGTIYGIDAAFDNFARGMLLRGLSALSLIGLFSPVLLVTRRRWVFRVAIGFCLFQFLGSGLVFFGSLVSAMNPLSFTIHLFTFKVLYLDDIGSQFLYFACRGALWFSAMMLLLLRKEEPNKAPEPTTMAVTPRALSRIPK